MIYTLLVTGSIAIAILAGVFIAFNDSMKTNETTAHLGKLDNSDLPCGDVFDSLELTNAWGNIKN